MSVERKLSDQDNELLSAYLDGALSADERAALEARLAGEPDLRRDLAGLRQTVQLIRALPAIRPPRDFTLTTAMVRPARWLVFPTSAAFSALSAAAALLLVLGALALWMSAGAPRQMAPETAFIAAQPTGVQPQDSAGADLLGETAVTEPTQTQNLDGAVEAGVLATSITAPDEVEEGQEAGAGLADSVPPEAALASVPQPTGLPSPQVMQFAEQLTPSPMGTPESPAPMAAAAAGEAAIEPSMTPGVERAALTTTPTETLAPSPTPPPTETPTDEPTAPPALTITPAPQLEVGVGTLPFDLLPVLLLMGAGALVAIALGTTWARRGRR